MEVNMGTLDKLKLVVIAPKRKNSATEERRDKMVAQHFYTFQVRNSAIYLSACSSTCSTEGTDKSSSSKLAVMKSIELSTSRRTFSGWH
jgi:hypothetical protein